MANFKIFNSINKNIIKKDYINMYKINSSIIDKEYLQNIDLIKKEDYAFEKYLNHYDKDEYDGYEDEYENYENKKVFNKYQIEKINFITNSIELIIKENKNNNFENEFDPNNNTQNIVEKKLQEFVFSLISKDVSNNSKELLMKQVNSFSFLDSNFAFKFLRIFDFDYAKYNKDSEKEIFDYFLLPDEQCLFFFNILTILIKDPNFLFNEKNSFYINNLVKKLDFHNEKSLNETMLVDFFENILNSKKDTFLDSETIEFLFSKYTFINKDLNFKIVETIFNSPTNDQFISDFSLKDMLINFSNKLDIDSKLKINKLVTDSNLGTVCIDYINAFSALPKNKIYFSTLKYIFDNLSLEKKQVNLHLELVENMILKDENNSLDLNMLIHSLDFKDENVSSSILYALLCSNREKFNLTLNSVNVLFSKSPTFSYSSYNNFLSKLLIDETSEVNSNIINEHLNNKNNYLYVNNYVSVFINSIVLSDKAITLTEKTVLKLVNQFYLQKNVENDKIYSFLDSLINKKNIITSYSTINSFLKTLLDKNKDTNNLLLHLLFFNSILEANKKTPIEHDLFSKLIENSLPFMNSIKDTSSYSFFNSFVNYINNPIHDVSDKNILLFFEKFNISNMIYFDSLLRLNDKNFNLVLKSFAKPILTDQNYDSQYEIQALISISQSNNVSPLKLSKIIEVIIENPTLSLTSKVAILLSLSPKYLDVLINSKTFINSLKKLTDEEKEMILKELNKPKDYMSLKLQQNSILFQKIFSDDFKKDKLNSIFVPSLSNNIRYISSILKRSKDFEFFKEDQTALYSVLKTDSNNYKKVILDITKFSFFKKDRTEELQSFIDDIIIRKEIISNFSNINLNSSSIPQSEILSNIYKNIKFLIDFNFLDIKTSIIKDIDKLINFDLKSVLFEYNIDTLKVITEKDTNFINSVNKQIEDLKSICLEQIHYQFTTMSVEEVKIDVAKINHDLLIEKNLEIDSNLILKIYNLKNKNIPTKLNTLLDKFFEIRLANFNGLYNYQVKLITNQMDSILNLFSLLILLPKEEQNKKINRDGLSSIDFFDINLSKIDSNLNEILESFKKISVLDKISLIRDTSIKEKSLSTIKTNSSGPK